MSKILFASNNPGKLTEAKQILSGFEVVSPADINLDPAFDPEESGTTFEANSFIKAKAFALQTGLVSIADDSGLEVDALDGRPGVYSKRYGNDDEHRNLKLLEELKDIPQDKRTARFVSAITLYDPNTLKHVSVRGTVEGSIALESRGDQGFGYDPVFIPNDFAPNTFAQVGPQEKNQISHRARALEKIKQLLTDNFS